MPVQIDPKQDALGIIDLQPAFMPGGAIPAPGGHDVIAPINRLLRAPFLFRFATQDWHPVGNITFASSHPGRKPLDCVATKYGPMKLWPDHAIEGTAEAALHPELDLHRVDLILRKGAGVELMGNSAFSDLGGEVRSGLASMLEERGVRRLLLAGLALDVCVAATAKDAAALGIETVIVEDACRAGDPARAPQVKAELEALGVSFMCERDLLAA